MIRVLSERLVLFYAQSGAGKTSLLNTMVIPELLFTLAGHDDAVLHAAWSPNEMWIATAGKDGTVRIWQGR